MAVNLSPIGNDAPFLDANGDPLSGGLLYSYTAGSSTPQTTFTTQAGSVANANPVVLNSGGYPASGGSVVEIWLTAGVEYKFTLKTSAGVTVWDRDDIQGINDTAISVDQWSSGPAPTFVSTVSFTLVGDQTAAFHVGRRVKTTNTGGTIYSTITASAFAAATTITVVNDSGVLDSGLSAVSYGLLSATNPAVPVLADSDFVISGSSDRTKKAKFEVDGLTTATTRTYTLQDSSDTLIGRATTDTLTNKTLTSPTITTPTLNGALAGTSIATQAEQETGTAVDKIVTPGRQQFHPSAAKAWAQSDNGTTIDAGYNITSVTDSGTGNHTFNWGTDFSGTAYAVVSLGATTFASSAATTILAQEEAPSRTAGASNILMVRASDGALADPSTSWSVLAFGDQ